MYDLNGHWGWPKFIKKAFKHVKKHWRSVVHRAISVGVALASVAGAAAFSAGTGGVGCVIVASVALSAGYGTGAHLLAAAAMRERITARKAFGWIGSSFTAPLGRAYLVGRTGKSPLKYLIGRIRAR